MEDEDRHRQIFEILAAALDDNDQLVPEETADSLAQKIRAVGEFFAPRALRSRRVVENPLGSGGRVSDCAGEERSMKSCHYSANCLMATSGIYCEIEPPVLANH